MTADTFLGRVPVAKLAASAPVDGAIKPLTSGSNASAKLAETPQFTLNDAGETVDGTLPVIGTAFPLAATRAGVRPQTDLALLLSTRTPAAPRVAPGPDAQAGPQYSAPVQPDTAIFRTTPEAPADAPARTKPAPVVALGPDVLPRAAPDHASRLAKPDDITALPRPAPGTRIPAPILRPDQQPGPPVAVAQPPASPPADVLTLPPPGSPAPAQVPVVLSARGLTTLPSPVPGNAETRSPTPAAPPVSPDLVAKPEPVRNPVQLPDLPAAAPLGSAPVSTPRPPGAPAAVNSPATANPPATISPPAKISRPAAGDPKATAGAPVMSGAPGAAVGTPTENPAARVEPGHVRAAAPAPAASADRPVPPTKTVAIGSPAQLPPETGKFSLPVARTENLQANTFGPTGPVVPPDVKTRAPGQLPGPPVAGAQVPTVPADEKPVLTAAIVPQQTKSAPPEVAQAPPPPAPGAPGQAVPIAAPMQFATGAFALTPDKSGADEFTSSRDVSLAEPLINRSSAQGDRPVGPSQFNGAVQRSIDVIVQTASQLRDRPVEITLNPEELGRVRLTLRPSDGSMAVLISVERPETLELLRRHISELASQLRDIGYQDMSFDFAGQDKGFDDDEAAETGMYHDQDDAAPAVAASDPHGAMRLTVRPASGVDIRL